MADNHKFWQELQIEVLLATQCGEMDAIELAQWERKLSEVRRNGPFSKTSFSEMIKRFENLPKASGLQQTKRCYGCGDYNTDKPLTDLINDIDTVIPTRPSRKLRSKQKVEFPLLK